MMNKIKFITQQLGTVQNLGLNDRVIRGVIAALMIGLPSLDLALGGILGGIFGWHGYVILLSIYPALTAILGWDPLYSLFQIRSCGVALHNQCGTFPYQVADALGRNPVVDKGYEFDHSLSSVPQQHDTGRRDAMTSKTQNRWLILATVILTLAVIAYMFGGGK